MENENIPNNKTKKNVILAIILVISLITIAFSVSFAFFSKNIVKNGDDPSADVTTGKLNVDFLTSQYIANIDAHLINDDEAYLKADKSIFTIERAVDNTTRNVYYVIDLTNVAISDNLKQSTYFKWALYDTEEIDSSSVAVATGNFTSVDNNKLSLISDPISLPEDEVHAYTLLVWVSNDSEVLQNDLLEGTFSAKVTVTAVNSN